MKDLAKKNILPYRKSDVPFSEDEIESLLEILSGWKIVEREGLPRLDKSFPFDDFRAAMVFTNQIADLAEEADHHPAILVSSIRTTVTWWTHIFKRLHLNDFIMAARTHLLFQEKND